MHMHERVSTLALSGSRGNADSQGDAARFSGPAGVAFDGDGNAFVGHSIRKITPDGTVTTLAGGGLAGFADGQGTAAQFSGPTGVAVDMDGNVIVADKGNHRIRKITPDGAVTTLAGSGNDHFADGRGTAASFSRPCGVAVGGDGNIIVCDYSSHLIRKITPDGAVTTLAGSRPTAQHAPGEPPAPTSASARTIIHSNGVSSHAGVSLAGAGRRGLRWRLLGGPPFTWRRVPD